MIVMSLTSWQTRCAALAGLATLPARAEACRRAGSRRPASEQQSERRVVERRGAGKPRASQPTMRLFFGSLAGRLEPARWQALAFAGKVAKPKVAKELRRVHGVSDSIDHTPLY